MSIKPLKSSKNSLKTKKIVRGEMTAKLFKDKILSELLSSYMMLMKTSRDFNAQTYPNYVELSEKLISISDHIREVSDFSLDYSIQSVMFTRAYKPKKENK
jgi:hypothetical protein